MRARKILTFAVLSLILLAALGTGTNILPRVISAHAISCPSGGASNACLTVSLDMISKPTATATATCAVPTGQKGVCDTLVNTSASNATTFRIGAILNTTATNQATSTVNCGGIGQIQCGVYGWQFQINYNTSLVTPVGDPSSFCAGYPDCAESTVWYGSQTGSGTVNWAGAIAGRAASPLIFTREDPTTRIGQILVGFSYFLPNGLPVVISARSVLASVAFELVGKGKATFTVTNVLFVDQNGAPIPGITGTTYLQNDPLSRYVDTNANGVWDAGEPVVYDRNNDGKYSAGTSYTDPLIAGSAPANNTALTFDPKIKYVDLDGNAVWESTETVVYDANNNNFYDTSEPLIAGSTPSTPCVGGALPSSTCGLVTDTITNDPPHASFTTIQVSAYVFSFDAGASTDSDGTIADPGGYYWDFGDGTNMLAGLSLLLPPHDYSSMCTPTCPNGLSIPGNFTVTLRVVDDLGATGSARDAFGAVLVNGQPSHAARSVIANKNPIAAFTQSPQIPSAGQTVTFDASTSTDDGTIISYSWSFGDGSPNSTGTTTSHVFNTPNTYTVTLAIKDSFNAVTTITHMLVVDTPPTLTVTAPATGQTGSTVTVSLSSSTSFPGGSITSVKVDWGDGQVDTLSGSATSATHTYTNAGNYNVTITATDNNGKTSVKSQTIDVTTPTSIPGGILTLIALPIIAVVAIAAVLLRRRKKSASPPKQ